MSARQNRSSFRLLLAPLVVGSSVSLWVSACGDTELGSPTSGQQVDASDPGNIALDSGQSVEDASDDRRDGGTSADASSSVSDAGDLVDSGVEVGGDAAVRSDAGMSADAAVIVDAGTSGTDAGTTVGTGEIDLGEVALADGASPELEFDLPEGLTTFTVIITGSDAYYYVVQRLEGPTGVLVTDVQGSGFGLPPFPAQYNSPNRVVAQREGVGVGLFPNNPNVSVRGGHYVMSVAGADSNGGGVSNTSVHVRVLYKAKAVTSGTLDLSLYFSGASDLTAANAPTSQLVIDTIDQLRTIYRQANIEIGTISYFDIDAKYRTISTIQGPGNDLNLLFQESAGHGPGLHFFFVDRIENPLGFGVIGGVAGGLPGPPHSQGSSAAGVAVAVSFANNDPGLLAHVMGHEGGHWLGLSHTQEIFFSIEDQMPDTPTGQPGTAFLMYPEASASAGHEISPSQADVMRFHIETVNP